METVSLEKFKYFKIEQIYDNKILIVTLNRPPVNAFIKESYQELTSIIQYANNNLEICTLILRAEGNIFSAGADVKQLAKDTLQESAVRRTILREAGDALYTCKVPVIVAVNGAAVGAGAGFAAYGDIIVASDNAYFSIPEINVGVIGGAADLRRLLPPQKIRTLALTGKPISVQDIYKYGGIESIVSQEELYDEALKYAKVIASKGSLSVRKWKEALLATENVSLAEATFIEQCLSQELSLQTPSPTVKKFEWSE